MTQQIANESSEHLEYVRAMRALTPKQRRCLRELPKYHGQFWTCLVELGYSYATGHRWMRKPAFKKARELVEKRALDAVGINHTYILSQTKEVVERSMQAVPVRDDEGNQTGEYTFEGNVALKGLDMLGKYARTWGDEAAKQQAPIGPGLTVIVQTAGGQAAVRAQPGAQGRVVVDLPGPE